MNDVLLLMDIAVEFSMLNFVMHNYWEWHATSLDTVSAALQGIHFSKTFVLDLLHDQHEQLFSCQYTRLHTHKVWLSGVRSLSKYKIRQLFTLSLQTLWQKLTFLEAKNSMPLATWYEKLKRSSVSRDISSSSNISPSLSASTYWPPKRIDS